MTHPRRIVPETQGQGAEVVVVRHAETEWSRDKRHTGLTDVPLTAAGRDAARALRPLLSARDFALVLTSPLERAAETAGLAGLTAEVEADLAEWDYGAYEGRRTVDIREERPGWSLWTDGVPGGETPEQVAARADRVIARALAAGGDVALVAHGHLLRVLAARWIEQPPAHGERLQLDPGGVGVLAHDRGTRVLRSWNATVHF